MEAESSNKSKMRVCTRCVLPETFPGIHFDDEGICNFCLDFKGIDIQQRIKDEYRRRFETILARYRDKNNYDVLVCYSGGKDSTYTLSILKERYNLKILALSFDNGFISNQTMKNIETVVEKLNVDHIFFKPRFDVLARIFRHCISEDVFTPKALERASSICTSCMAILKYSTMRFAIEKNIPFIAFGWSPGQASIASSVMKNNPLMLKAMQKSLYDPLFRIAGKEIEPYFLADYHFRNTIEFPYYIHPLAFSDYSERVIFENILRLGWQAPDDVGSTTTNCLLNSFANIAHQQRLGFHPYAFEMANLVREGHINREVALKKLNRKDNPDIIVAVRKKLGIKENINP